MDPHRQLRLVAHMLGDVALTGSFDVRLHGGRFCGVTRQGGSLFRRGPAVSYHPAWGGASANFKTVSSFSFESDHGTGLREELGIEGKEGALLSIEYSFRDDSPLSPCLEAISRSSRWPAGRRVRAACHRAAPP